MNIFEYNRIIIVGNNGSGKSYLSKELSDITGLPLVHLDVEFWRPNWQMPSKEDWEKKIIELISEEKWIIDGNVNHGGTLELRNEATDLIIFLDINRFVCLSGVFKRHGKKRSDLPQHLEEKWDKDFFRFLKGLWCFSKTRKRTIIDSQKKHPDKPLFVIKSRREMNKWLNQWRDEKIKYTKSSY